MRSEKKSFIENELKQLLCRIDSKIHDVKAVPNMRGDDISHVCIVRDAGAGGGMPMLRERNINVECDSLTAITQDVLKAIT